MLGLVSFALHNTHPHEGETIIPVTDLETEAHRAQRPHLLTLPAQPGSRRPGTRTPKRTPLAARRTLQSPRETSLGPRAQSSLSTYPGLLCV